MKLSNFFNESEIEVQDGVLVPHNLLEERQTQRQTIDVFGEKWTSFSETDQSAQNIYDDFQKNWFLTLYGFESENELKDYLADKKTILDAGAGLAEKAAWLSNLAPHATVIAADYSDAIYSAQKNFKLVENMVFLQCDIADTRILDAAIDCVICDQVIMHTEDPTKTLQELSRIVSDAGEVFCYWYRKKALPRELLDDYFRQATLDASHDEIWELSEQLTQLGQTLSKLNATINVPDMPLLNIKGGEYDLQRFIYWNFIKCFWNSDMGYETSKYVNFDWYSPSNAKRFSKNEVEADLKAAGLSTVSFHEEEACYAGRFRTQA
jgi:ubiquinone/menaquinone biosynthesis C-methylase UbiE